MRENWSVYADAEAVASAACLHVAQLARTALLERDRFRLVLAGGRTPRRCYEMLADTTQDWDRWTLYYGDERCLPREDPGRNSTMVAASGLGGRVGDERIIPAELGARAGATAYAASLDPAPFDLVILGMGEDGHTASLFPGHPEATGEDVVAVDDAPKPPAERVSLTAQRLRNTRDMLILVTGAGKVAAVNEWKAGADLPVSRVARDNTRVMLDRAAAP